jgi:polyphenol oxidase
MYQRTKMTWISAYFKQRELGTLDATKVVGGTTTRQGGYSRGCYEGLNLGAHVGDNVSIVDKNRDMFIEDCALPSRPVWLNQTHSTKVIELPIGLEPSTSFESPATANSYHITIGSNTDAINADACFTQKKGIVCSVMTADCLPILLVDKNATVVGAIHAGWRGLAAGIIEETFQKICAATKIKSDEFHVWLGPAIGANAFEVGQDVYDIFGDKFGLLAQPFFKRQMQSNSSQNNINLHDKNGLRNINHLPEQKYLADLAGLAQLTLGRLGIKSIEHSGLCTFQNPQSFYSYRRDGRTGRMVSFIYLK